MRVSRRRLLEVLALTGTGSAVKGAEAEVTVENLRGMSAVQGTQLSEERLRILKPVVERRIRQLQPLRDFAFDDAIEPAQGILDK
jgi:hypothetical protein